MELSSRRSIAVLTDAKKNFRHTTICNLLVYQYLELFVSFDVTNVLMLITISQRLQLTPQHVFHSLSDHFSEENQTKQII